MVSKLRAYQNCEWTLAKLIATSTFCAVVKSNFRSIPALDVIPGIALFLVTR